MGRTKTSPGARSPGGTEKAEAGADHEALLMTAYRELPSLLAEELHSIEPLNEALRQRAQELRDTIRKRLEKVSVSAEQKKLWLAVPDLQFSPGKFDQPEINLGLTLYRRIDARGELKIIPEALCMVDFCVNVSIPTWNVGRISLSSTGTPPNLDKPADGLIGVGLSSVARRRVLGIVLTSEVTLGRAIREIERVRDAGMIDSVRNSYERPIEPYILCVTDRQELSKVLRDKVDVLFVGDGTLEYDFGYLQNLVGVSSH
ncbi:MAG: hypothetical protein A2580_06930 [Hydrogenophilales bacterium RIFOXYD1_FULL_62_11]|nr:MAG: hypothetical protein A2580_06930 [Hydrogenophilales bacterium RIFOXYD1_FULL_62_11]